jgi:hypothetical protein
LHDFGSAGLAGVALIHAPAFESQVRRAAQGRTLMNEAVSPPKTAATLAVQQELVTAQRERFRCRKNLLRRKRERLRRNKNPLRRRLSRLRCRQFSSDGAMKACNGR